MKEENLVFKMEWKSKKERKKIAYKKFRERDIERREVESCRIKKKIKRRD